MKSWMTSIAAAGLLVTAATAQTSHLSYSVQDLGVVGGSPGQPYWITNNGLIAGAAGAANKDMHATVWFMGFKVDLGSPGFGGPNSEAHGINGIGQVVGAAQTTAANGEDFCGFSALGNTPSSTTCLPFLWQNGVMTKLPTLGGPNGFASFINNRGQAVGYAETTGRDPNPACPVLQFKPVIWENGAATQLRTFADDTNGIAAAINDNGQAVGASGSCAGFNPNSEVFLVEKHAVLWQGGSAVDLGNLGGTGAGAGNHACAINNRGQVVGHSDLAGNTTFHGFLWTWESGMRDIGTLPGDMASLGLAINDQGVSVGASLNASFDPRAFVFENGEMTDLNSVLSSNPQKLYLLLAFSVNSHRQIVGLAATSDGNLHGFLATPATGGTYLPASDRATSLSSLSDSDRKLVFRRLGIGQR